MEEVKVNGKSLVLPSPKEETPFSAVVVCLRKEDIKRFEETEECFILDFDPFHSLNFSNLSLYDKNNHQDDDDDADHVSIIAEKGQVACRDYPHPRHLCIRFPFTTTPHESYCEKCYCSVCDSVAPCKHWTRFTNPHCDATLRDEELWIKVKELLGLIEIH